MLLSERSQSSHDILYIVHTSSVRYLEYRVLHMYCQLSNIRTEAETENRHSVLEESSLS